MNKVIPLSKPDITEAEISEVVEVLQSGVLSIGPKIIEFEKMFCEYFGKKHAIAVNSGTSALHLLIRAFDIKDGDEVITTPYSFIASSNCILFERAKPVFVDIDEKTYNIDIDKIEAAITPKTKAILPVDVFGQPVDMDAINDIARKHNLVVIEDACEAIGSEINGKKAGTQGDAGVFAFYPNKQITTAEGGVIVTDNDEVAELCRSMRSQGRAVTGLWLYHERLGYNFRLSELHAALGIVQMKRLDEIIEKRAHVAQTYMNYLKNIQGITLPYISPQVTKMSWFVLVIKLDENIEREQFINFLLENGVSAKPYFTPIHLQPFYREMGYKEGNYPVTEKVGAKTVALPFYNTLTEEEIRYIAEVVNEEVGKLGY